MPGIYFEFRLKPTKKIVALAISKEKLIFMIFFYVLLLSYKPSNFARANLHYAVG